MGRLIHTGLGSSSLIAHVLHSPPPPQYLTWVEAGKCGPGAVLGSGSRGALPLGRHLEPEQVTLYNICSLGMYRTQPRPARAALLPRQPPRIHPPKHSAWHCCGACAGPAHVLSKFLHYPLPPREQLCTRYCSNKHTSAPAKRHENSRNMIWRGYYPLCPAQVS